MSPCRGCRARSARSPPPTAQPDRSPQSTVPGRRRHELKDHRRRQAPCVHPSSDPRGRPAHHRVVAAPRRAPIARLRPVLAVPASIPVAHRPHRETTRPTSTVQQRSERPHPHRTELGRVAGLKAPRLATWQDERDRSRQTIGGEHVDGRHERGVFACGNCHRLRFARRRIIAARSIGPASSSVGA
jgi:hypothetical protein